MKTDILHLDPDEHIIMEVRKHWIVFFGHSIGLLFSAFLPFILLTALSKLAPQLMNVQIEGNIYALAVFVYTIWLLFLWILFFVDWTKYYLDVWYVTEKRIIAIDQRNIFDRGISNLRFDRIQDVTINVKGFLPTLLRFGDIRVQTAGEDNLDFSMTVVRHPENVRKVIFSRHNVNNLKP